MCAINVVALGVELRNIKIGSGHVFCLTDWNGISRSTRAKFRRLMAHCEQKSLYIPLIKVFRFNFSFFSFMFLFFFENVPTIEARNWPCKYSILYLQTTNFRICHNFKCTCKYIFAIRQSHLRIFLVYILCVCCVYVCVCLFVCCMHVFL